MRGASRVAFAEARDRLTTAVSDPEVAATVGDELFAVVQVFGDGLIFDLKCSNDNSGTDRGGYRVDSRSFEQERAMQSILGRRSNIRSNVEMTPSSSAASASSTPPLAAPLPPRPFRPRLRPRVEGRPNDRRPRRLRSHRISARVGSGAVPGPRPGVLPAGVRAKGLPFPLEVAIRRHSEKP